MFRHMINLSIALLSITLFSLPALASGSDDPQNPTESLRLLVPEMDAIKGKTLFIEKACITCHSINGVGGEDGPPIGVDSMDAEMNVFEFAARMWNRAHGMLAAQMSAFKEQIQLSGKELAHIIAFVHDEKVQQTVVEADIPHHITKMMDHKHEGEGDEDDAADHEKLRKDHHGEQEGEQEGEKHTD